MRAHLELSRLTYPIALSGLDPLIFEASIVPHFVVGHAKWPVAVVLTPKIVVRMFNEESEPLRTPSYMPTLTVFGWLRARVRRDRWFVYGSLVLGHHSNGQSGPFFNADGSINHQTGNFDTTYLGVALHLSQPARAVLGWTRLYFEWHPKKQSPELAGRYGLLRLNIASQVLDTNGGLRSRLRVQVGAILDDFLHAKSSGAGRTLERFPLHLQYFANPRGLDLGLYAAYSMGHDDYNIWFDRWVHMLQVGFFAGLTTPSTTD
jgi:hypothetical protein